jgi:hypothetical protein
MVPAGKHIYGRSSETKDTLLFNKHTRKKTKLFLLLMDDTRSCLNPTFSDKLETFGEPR